MYEAAQIRVAVLIASITTGTKGTYLKASQIEVIQAFSNIRGSITIIHDNIINSPIQSSRYNIISLLPTTISLAVLSACIGYTPGNVTTTSAKRVVDIQ